ncbi:8641_t:CDS:2 [Funneliformis mosseae]|uniref:8641_t:CDS:1 n=1 Tax=Funneliformis mosseae TaxID=27381 RepID=A0A9N8W5I8_FUNMO|nr:8641_t:CDS:2 [Funneliformis mosseae]
MSGMAEHWRHLNRLQDVDFENDSFISIAEAVYYQLKDRYNSIPGTDILPEQLSKLELIKFEKQNDMIDYYREHQVIGDPTIPPVANIGNISNTYCILPCYQRRLSNEKLPNQAPIPTMENSFCPIYLENSPPKVPKIKSSDSRNFDEEYKKAADNEDFVFWSIAGRTFLLMQSNGFNVNDATYSQLTAVTRIGQNRALSLMSGRAFKELEGCFQGLSPTKYR